MSPLAPLSRRGLAACGLSLSACAAAQAFAPLQTSASGVFINGRGDVLTARHAVADCKSVYAVKDGRVSEATVLAMSEERDIAIVGTRLQPYLTATFAITPDDGKGGKPVFAESYEVLQGSSSMRGTLFNALTVPGGGLSLLSPARPGASGSAVLDGGGRYLGMVVERVALASGAAPAVLSAAATGAMPGVSRVKAVPVRDITAFLRADHISFTESDTPQLDAAQAVGPRAHTLAVGIICG